nr:ABC transporter ATP-binding protein [Anaerolineae bacterium]
LFQDPDDQLIMPTVEEDVAFGPRNIGLSEDEVKRRVEWSLKRTGMWEYRKRVPHHLSLGEKKRVAIAGVLAMAPKLLLLDEPPRMGDPHLAGDGERPGDGGELDLLPHRTRQEEAYLPAPGPQEPHATGHSHSDAHRHADSRLRTAHQRDLQRPLRPRAGRLPEVAGAQGQPPVAPVLRGKLQRHLPAQTQHPGSGRPGRILSGSDRHRSR